MLADDGELPKQRISQQTANSDYTWWFSTLTTPGGSQL
jgi:hypothetical protein